MHQGDIESLAVRLTAFTALLEQHSVQALEQSATAAQGLRRTAQEVAASSERVTARAIEEFKRAAATVVAEGMRQPLAEAGKSMQTGSRNVQAATDELERQIKALQKVHVVNAWKVFIASVVASVTLIGVAVYVGIKSHQEMTRSEWVGQINAAIANGKLGACTGGGLCAYLDKKVVRLDK